MYDLVERVRSPLPKFHTMCICTYLRGERNALCLPRQQIQRLYYDGDARDPLTPLYPMLTRETHRLDF